jgi:NhaA family Na+:H+ antiporter
MWHAFKKQYIKMINIQKKKDPIDSLMSPIVKFIKLETSGSLVLFVCAAVAMILANSPLSDSYFHFWHTPITVGFGEAILSQDLHHWVNDGLMGIFFFVIGLEIKREIIGGELSSFKKAVLPLAAGFGGMVFPALIYLVFNLGHEGVDGWGIPMATDIAFALGILSILGNRVPLSLKIFLTALAIADDLGAVLVIAFFYTSEIHFNILLLGAGIFGIMILMNRLGVRNTFVYGLFGIGGLWLAFLLSGVHATLAGVLAALAIPARTKINETLFVIKIDNLLAKFKTTKNNGTSLITTEQLYLLDNMKKSVLECETPLQKLEHRMHKLVIFFVMPVFALANAGLVLNKELFLNFSSPVTLGIMFGLIVGKFLGIVLLCKLMVKLKWAELPSNCGWNHIYGTALLAGVGFTMSLFITKLAFASETFELQAKLGVIAASIIAGVTGFLILRFSTQKNQENIL